MDREEETLAQHEVDLVGLRLVGARQREHHEVDDVADHLDLRPLVALDDVLCDQRMQSDQLSDRLDDSSWGLGQVDPGPRLLVREEGRQLAGSLVSAVTPSLSEMMRRAPSGG